MGGHSDLPANADGTVTFAGTTYRAGRQWARTAIDVTIVCTRPF